MANLVAGGRHIWPCLAELYDDTDPPCAKYNLRILIATPAAEQPALGLVVERAGDQAQQKVSWTLARICWPAIRPRPCFPLANGSATETARCPRVTR